MLATSTAHCIKLCHANGSPVRVLDLSSIQAQYHVSNAVGTRAAPMRGAIGGTADPRCPGVPIGDSTSGRIRGAGSPPMAGGPQSEHVDRTCRGIGGWPPALHCLNNAVTCRYALLHVRLNNSGRIGEDGSTPMAGKAQSGHLPCCPQHPALPALMSLCLFLFLLYALRTSFWLPQSASWMLHVLVVSNDTSRNCGWSS